MTKRTMIWKQMIEPYPAKWIVIQNAVMDGSDIMSGIVVDVIGDEEIIDYRASHSGKGLKFRRTDEEAMSGIVG